MRAQLRARRPRRRGPLPPPLRARQGSRGRAASTPRRFEHYADGQSAAPRRTCATTPTRRPTTCGARKALFTPDFFAAAGRARAHRRPIRSSSSACRASGSTLVEQILSSHSAGRGHDGAAGHHRASRASSAAPEESDATSLPGGAGEARAPTDLRALGERYLAQHAHPAQDRTRRFFIDKMPNNFAHVGLIHLILPNAEDHRCAPPSAGLLLLRRSSSISRAGRTSPTSLEDIGRYYRDYVELMAHFDARAAGPRPSRHLRTDGRRHGGRGAAAARLLRPAVRGGLPAVLRERPRRAHGQFRTGPPADLPRCGRPLAPLRAVARAPARRPSARCSTAYPAVAGPGEPIVWANVELPARIYTSAGGCRCTSQP